MAAPNGERFVPATCPICKKGFTAEFDYSYQRYAQFCSKECSAYSHRIKQRKASQSLGGF